MITIGIPKIRKEKKKARLSCEIEINDEIKILWVEVDEKYANYLVKDRCDAFLIAMLPVAMREKKDIICLSPVSEELLHNIRMQLIPTLVKSGKDLYKTRISTDIEKHPIKSSGAIGAFISRDISSMNILETYLDSEFKQMNISHLCLLDFEKEDNKEQIINENIETSLKLAEELDFPSILVKSNILKDFPTNFALDNFYYNIFPIFALQKMFKLFYYGSGEWDLEHFLLKNCDKIGCSHFELLLSSVFSTQNLCFSLDSGHRNIIEKMENIIHFAPAQKYLHVCSESSKNCGKCINCMRTLLILDGLDRLDYFSQVFDIEEYKKNRKKYISYLERCHSKKIMANEPIYNLFDKKGMLCCSSPQIIDVSADFPEKINTYSLIVKNLSTNKILMQKQTKETFSTLGIAKIMTALLALESGKSQMLVDVPEGFVKNIKRATIYDLVNVLMITQNNEAADIIAEAVCGSVEDFVELMNKKAGEIRIVNTHFSSPSGVDREGYTNVEDVVLLLEYAFKNQHFCQIFKSKTYTMSFSEVETKISTLNPLFLPRSEYYLPECIATKFGLFGIMANNIVVAEKDNQLYLAVLMGIKEDGKTKYRFRDAVNLIKAVLK